MGPPKTLCQRSLRAHRIAPHRPVANGPPAPTARAPTYCQGSRGSIGRGLFAVLTTYRPKCSPNNPLPSSCLFASSLKRTKCREASAFSGCPN